jgi:hypothetical protein
MLMLLTVAVGCSTSDYAVPATATATTYNISGVVSGDIAAGVIINLTGATTVTATTAADGTYSFTGLTDGRTYTLTPILAGYTFNPGSTVVIFNGSDMAADFVATTTASSHTISGTVTYAGGSGVKITFSRAGATAADVLTGADGTYTSPSLPDGTYTVTPYRSGYSFTPPNSLPITLSGANSDGNNFEAEYANFTQADLAGTWVVHTLETGTANGWSHVNVTIDSTGTLIFTDCLDSTTSTTCPTGTIVWTINSLSGVISETVGGVLQDNHYSLSSNKNFIAGRQHSVSTSHPGLLIAQKKVTGTVYANADVRSKNFVFHQLNVGSSNKWQYGAGHTSSTGAINISSETDPSGTDTPGDIGATISVDNNGVVSMNDNTTWGFLSADKRTIIGTATEGTSYYMKIIQLIDGQSSSYMRIVGGYYGYMLATGTAPAPFWAYQLIDLSGGVMSSWTWDCSNAAVTPPGTKTISVSLSGAVTSTNSDFNGQLSYDQKFMVGTETFDAGVFALDVIIY